jgi:dihydrodipicolinate synthase/N-acetylneuraminate lyase
MAALGSNTTSEDIELARRAEAAGADAILTDTSRHARSTGVYAYFNAIANATASDHSPPRASTDEALIRLSKLGRVVGFVDGTSNTARCVRLRRLLPAGFRLLSGDDLSALPYFACRGDGCISLVATVAPELCQAIYLTAGRDFYNPQDNCNSELRHWNASSCRGAGTITRHGKGLKLTRNRSVSHGLGIAEQSPCCL